MSKNRRHNQRKAANAKKAQAQANRAMDKSVRADMKQQGDQAPGTSPASLGIVKMQSEEARHETCFECGYSGGRHARLCPRR